MHKSELPSGILTFLFSDIQGSTPLWEKDPQGMSAALELHNRALQGAIRTHGGRVFKIIGDEFQVMFRAPAQAIRAAVAAQRALAETAWGHIGPLRVRMGIHTGPATWEGHDYAVSHTFNRTARIMSCAHGGQILISAEAVEAFGEGVDVALQDMGRHRLKGMTQREHLYQVNAPGLPQEFPPLKTIGGAAPPVAHNLPEPSTPFVGRHQELAELGRRFAAEGTRLVTIVGAGGMGKTRLALEYAWRRRGQYASGVHFISLAPLGDPAQILPATAAAVGLTFKGERDPQEQLLRHLKSWQTLLVFDNFEHLLDGAGLLTRIVEGAPQVDLLATSRARLAITSECLFELGGLALPLDGDGRAALPVADAVRMFQTYARRVRPDFELGPADWQPVVGLCRLVEGMPLAIELAAAWTRSLTPAEILEELAADLQILERESPDAPPRQRSMQASFDYSWRMLNQAERQVLMKLSVFRGGCTREAAREVAGANALVLSSLVDKSMLRRDPKTGRYQMHELLRQMAQQRLEANCLAHGVKRDHADYYLAVFERAGQAAGDEHGQAALQKLFKAEIDNCRAAMERSLTPERAEAALRLAMIIREEGDLLHSEEARCLEEPLKVGGERLPPALRARAQLQVARLHLQNDMPVERERWARAAAAALALYEELGDERGTAEALRTLGFCYFGRDFALASAYYRQAIAIQERLGENAFSCVLQLAWVHQFEGCLAEVRQLFGKLMAIARQNQEEMRVILVRALLAELDYYEGKLDQASGELQGVLAYRSSEGRPIPDWIRYLAQGTLLNIALAEDDLAAVRRLVGERLAHIKKWDSVGTVIFLFHQIALWQHRLEREREAAFWIGCFQRVRDEADQPLDKPERPRFQKMVKEVKNALGRQGYQAAYDEGYATGIDDALDRGLALAR